MLGAIAGDIIGSVYEFNPWRGDWRDFPLFSKYSGFTDDTILTFAVAKSLIDCGKDENLFHDNLLSNFRISAETYPFAGYGTKFYNWVFSEDIKPYNSYGNGSAMRVSPVGWAFDTLEEVEKWASISADVTHNHPEGIKGACSTAGSIFLARKGKSKNEIRDYVVGKYGYNLNRRIDEIRLAYEHIETCQDSVPEAIIAFLESNNFEDAVRRAVWLGGDADTQADIAGAIAEAFYDGVPYNIAKEIINHLDENLHDQLLRWKTWNENRL